MTALLPEAHLSPRSRAVWPGWCQRLTESPWPWLNTPESGLCAVAMQFDEGRYNPDDLNRQAFEAPPALCRAAPKRQAEFIAGRLCAGEAIRQLRGVMSFPTAQSDGAPHWPCQIRGSITHSAGTAMSVVGDSDRYSGIGLDVEAIQNRTEARALTGLVLTADEQRRHQAALIANPGLCLTRIFSLKEALFKALYPQTLQRFYFQDAEVLSLNPSGLSRMRLRVTLSTHWPRGSEVDAFLSLWRDRVVALVLTGSEPALIEKIFPGQRH